LRFRFFDICAFRSLKNRSRQYCACEKSTKTALAESLNASIFPSFAAFANREGLTFNRFAASPIVAQILPSSALSIAITPLD